LTRKTVYGIILIVEETKNSTAPKGGAARGRAKEARTKERKN
jgi:hypothetical protein